MIASAAAKVVISLLVTVADGQEYAVQTWAPKDAQELRADWDTCKNLANDLEIAGRGSRAPASTGLRAKCKVEPVQVPAPADPQYASLQKISF